MHETCHDGRWAVGADIAVILERKRTIGLGHAKALAACIIRCPERTRAWHHHVDVMQWMQSMNMRATGVVRAYSVPSRGRAGRAF